jgi:hypothetical protein
MKRILLAACAVLVLSWANAFAAPSNVRLPEHVVGTYCGLIIDKVGYYSHSDVDEYKSDTCERKFPDEPDWFVVKADGSYYGWEWDCKAIKTRIVPGDGGERGYAAYNVTARCMVEEGDTWTEQTNLIIQKWGSSIIVTRKKQNKGK